MLTLSDLWRAVKAWRDAECSTRPTVTHVSVDGPGKYSLGVRQSIERCDGDNHLENCPVELARQDVIAVHDRTTPS